MIQLTCFIIRKNVNYIRQRNICILNERRQKNRNVCTLMTYNSFNKSLQ